MKELMTYDRLKSGYYAFERQTDYDKVYKLLVIGELLRVDQNGYVRDEHHQVITKVTNYNWTKDLIL